MWSLSPGVRISPWTFALPKALQNTLLMSKSLTASLHVLADCRYNTGELCFSVSAKIVYLNVSKALVKIVYQKTSLILLISHQRNNRWEQLEKLNFLLLLELEREQLTYPSTGMQCHFRCSKKSSLASRCGFRGPP